MKPLPWQTACLAEYDARNELRRDFVLVAGTGCGKTGAGGMCAARTYNNLDKATALILVVVPYRDIKNGWKKFFHDKYRYSVATKPQDMAMDTDVFVTTYAGAQNALNLIKSIGKMDLVIVFDEFHHMEESNTWAEPFLKLGLDDYVKRIFLSGTPWHESGDLSEDMVRYNENGVVEADFTYTYGQNVNAPSAERNTVAVVFERVDVKITYNVYDRAGVLIEEAVADTRETQRSDSLLSKFLGFKSAADLKTKPDLIGMLNKAVSKLDSIRSGQLPNAGGIVFVSSKDAAHAVRETMEDLYGIDALVVVSDDPTSHHAIQLFRRTAGQRWIIAIDMISEGVDIPRLKVAVDFTNKRTMMHIIQRWGRVLRLFRYDDGEAPEGQEAWVYMVNHAQLRYVATMIEDEVERASKDRVESEGKEPPEPGKFTSVETGREGEDSTPIYKGEILQSEIEDLADWIITSNYNGAMDKGFTMQQALVLARTLLDNGISPVGYDPDAEDAPPKADTGRDKDQIVKAYTRAGKHGVEVHARGDYERYYRGLAKFSGGTFSRANKTRAQLEDREREVNSFNAELAAGRIRLDRT